MCSTMFSIFYTEIWEDNPLEIQKNYQNIAKSEQKLVYF